jgi:hypothetical protein
MRRIAFVLGLVGGLVSLAAWFAGRRVEEQYHVLLMGAEGVPGLALATPRYERGLFHSELVTVIEPVAIEPDGAAWPADSAPPEPAVSAGTVRMVLHHVVSHGPYPPSWLRSEDFDGAPILAHVVTSPTLEIETAEALEEIVLPLAFESRFTRADGGMIRLRPDPARTDFEDPELDGDWTELEARLDFAYDGARFDGLLEVPRIVFDGEAGSLRIADLFYRFAYERVGEALAQPLYVGGSQLRLGALVVEAEGERFELRDLEIEDTSDVADESWSLQVRGSLDRVGGDETRLGSAELDYRMAGLALEPLAELAALVANLEDEGVDAAAVKAEAMGALGALWPRFMAAGPELEVRRFRLFTPDGEIRMALRVAVDASEPALLKHPLMTLPALEVDAELALPEKLVEHRLAASSPSLENPPTGLSGPDGPAWFAAAATANRSLEDWLARGLVERHGGSYVLSVRMRRGALRLNGRVVSLDAL